MISCVVVFDGRATRVVYDDHTSGVAPILRKKNLVRPWSWCWKTHFETKKQSQKWKDWSFVHFSVKWSCIILLSADCCLSQ